MELEATGNRQRMSDPSSPLALVFLCATLVYSGPKPDTCSWRNSHHARYLRPTFCQSMSIPVLPLEVPPATSPTAQFFHHQRFHHE
jgi:hypothetical protein